MTAFLIGGAARCGKSTLFRKSRKHFDGNSLDLDWLKPSIEYWSRPFAGDAILNAPSVYEYSPQEWLKQIRERDKIILDGVTSMIRAANKNHDDILLCGCIWPDWVEELSNEQIDVKAVFLVDNSEAHANRLIKIARSEEKANNWHADWSDEKITKWAEYNRLRSQTIYDQAITKNNKIVNVLDVEVLGLGEAQIQAYDFLFKNLSHDLPQ